MEPSKLLSDICYDIAPTPTLQPRWRCWYVLRREVLCRTYSACVIPLSKTAISTQLRTTSPRLIYAQSHIPAQWLRCHRFDTDLVSTPINDDQRIQVVAYLRIGIHSRLLDPQTLSHLLILNFELHPTRARSTNRPGRFRFIPYPNGDVDVETRSRTHFCVADSPGVVSMASVRRIC